MDDRLIAIEDRALEMLEGKFVNLSDQDRFALFKSTLLGIDSKLTDVEINEIYADITKLDKIDNFLKMSNIEDIMINNTKSTFVYDSKSGYVRVTDANFDTEELNRIVKKLKLYSTNQMARGNILDVHMSGGSRANIVSSPKGYDVTIRNFSNKPLSIIDLINLGELDYKIAARFWLYLDGFRIRPANMLIGGIAASGKTTLLNSMLSFFRPDLRLVTIEETYELNTEIFENSVNLETNEDMSLADLIKAAMRMRADAIIVGEVRGAEARDMLSVMNIGKMSISTIHASSARDVINRLTHSPMNVPEDIIPVIDAITILSRVNTKNGSGRKVVQVSEISGRDTQILLSDLYRYDYKAGKSTDILPSVSYRDTISKAIGVQPSDIVAEERLRSVILSTLNELGKRSIAEISDSVQEYYDNPEALLNRIGLNDASPVIRI